MTEPSEVEALLARVVGPLDLAVRPVAQDPRAWTVGTGDAHVVVRLGDAGGLTLGCSFAPFPSGEDGEPGLLDRLQFGSRVPALAAAVDTRIDAVWHPTERTAFLQRVLGPDEVDESSLRKALEALQEVVERTVSEASAVIQGVADAPPTFPDAPAADPIRPGDHPSTRRAVPLALPSVIVPAVLVTLCCVNPIGIFAIVFAVRAGMLARKGERARAESSARLASTLVIVALVVSVLLALAGFAFDFAWPDF